MESGESETVDFRNIQSEESVVMTEESLNGPEAQYVLWRGSAGTCWKAHYRNGMGTESTE